MEGLPNNFYARTLLGPIFFIILQRIMLAAIMIFPSLVTGGVEKLDKLNDAQVMEHLQTPKEEIKEKPRGSGD